MRSQYILILLLIGIHQLQNAIEAYAENANSASKLSSAISVIETNDLKRHVNVLADDTFEGRAAGTRGGRAAAGYIRKHLMAMNLIPAGDKGQYSQTFKNDCQNLLAIIPGNDADLKNEYILIGAHYDHVGYGSRKNSYGPTGYIHNGADDNASGTSALLEIAQALEMNPCRRSVIIAFWDGEEQGLWGSKHFVANPTVPFKQIRLAFNMDMVGRLRNNEIIIYGTRTWNGARSLISQVNSNRIEGNPLNIVFDWEIKENSDHHPFFKAGIPYLMPHTGLHDDYHRPRDDADKINSSGIEDVARLTYQVIMKIDQREHFPTFRELSAQDSPRVKKQFESPLGSPPKRLGLNWISQESSNDGLKVSRVERNSPAHDAGISRGDRIIEFNNIEVTSDTDMRNAVFSGPVNSVMKIIPSGQSDIKTVDVALRGQPMRLGISWRYDSGEPETPMVSRVISGSPAYDAGLKCTDRIHAINGVPWKTSDQIPNPFSNVPFPITIEYERNGRMYSAQLLGTKSIGVKTPTDS